LYYSSNIITVYKIKEDEMNGTCNRHGEMKNTYNLKMAVFISTHRPDDGGSKDL
jgi:hypothetical protein